MEDVKEKVSPQLRSYNINETGLENIKIYVST